MNGNLKLIKWRFVIHGCINMFSRAIMFLKCATSNKAAIVLESFIKATERFINPLRIRTDHGTEEAFVHRKVCAQPAH